MWKDNAFIIEAKAYDIKEPFRDPERAYKRILQDFNRSIGYAYKQTWRVAEKFYKQEPLEIKDEHGVLIDTIDTAKYKMVIFNHCHSEIFWTNSSRFI